MQRTCWLLALTLIPLLASTQVRRSWMTTWAGIDYYGLGRGVAVDSSGNVYVTGQTTVNGYFRGVIVKYEPGGHQLWSTTFGTTPTRMVVDGSGNVYITGTYYSGSFAYLVAKKCDPDGREEWTRTFALSGGAGGSDIAVDRSGNVYASGWGKIDTPKVRYRIVVVKYSGLGEKLWDLADSVETYVERVALAADERGAYVCAPVRGVTYVASYGFDGSRSWFKRYGKFGAYSPGYYGDIALDKHGNVYFTSSKARDTMAQVDLLAGAYTSAGGLLWEDTWICSANGMSTGCAIAVDDTTGSVFVTGLYYPDRTVNVKRAVTMKYTTQGSHPWTQTYQGTGEWDRFDGIAADHHGNVYVAGFTDRPDSGSVCLLMKYGPGGEVKWSKRDSVMPGDDTWAGVVVDSEENVYVGGNVTTLWRPYTIVLATAKYVQGPYFKPDPDGWAFSNSEIEMWPQSWWSQFDYSVPPYPLNFTTWPINARSSDFPDWPLFVEAFGDDQCYFSSTTTGSYVWKPSAILKWRSIVTQWGGSCFGFVTSSLLVYNDYLSLPEMFPEYESLLSVPLFDKSRRVVNKYMLYQHGETYQATTGAMYAKTPIQTARELVTMLDQDSTNRQGLSIWNNNGSGGHAVVPCKLVRNKGDPDVVDVVIYDPNYPGTKKTLSIDTVVNTWWYDELPGWGGSRWIHLAGDISTFAVKPDLSKAGTVAAQHLRGSGSDSASFPLYVTPGAGCLVVDEQGRAMGYDPSDSSLTVTIPGAVPIIRMTGRSSPPIGYLLPAGRYHAQVSSSEDTSLYLRTIRGDVITAYEEHATRPGEQTRFVLSRRGDTLLIGNPETRGRTGMLRSIRVSPGRELACDIADITLPGHDSLTMAMTEESSVRLQAGGSASTYTLSLTLAAPCTSLQFRHRGVALSGGSTHVVAPEWERLDSVPVHVYVDIDSDGTPDDTLTLTNEVTDVSDPRGAIDIPDTYRLEQNYPNPFNPVTTIRYGLPQKSDVRLTVFNVLGQEVAVLVEEEKEAGFHEVRLNGASLASGVYIYRLEAGAFIQSRKLIILR